MKIYLKSLVFTMFCAVCLALSFGNALAYDEGNILIRGRVISVNPSSTTTLPDDSELKVASAVFLEVDFTYMVNPNFGLELIVSRPNHALKVDGDKVGDVNVLPPTLLAQYHFMHEGPFKPYAGAGLNYTIYDAKADNGDKLKLDSSFGLAFQAGVDYEINEKWFVNADLKYIMMKTKLEDEIDVDINPLVFGIGIGTFF